MRIRPRPILAVVAAALVVGSHRSALGQPAPGTAAPATGDVEVRGAPVTPSGGELDASVAGSTIRRVELARPGLSAADALRTEVGTTVSETGGLGASATASIRGATAAETPVYLGGVRINDDVAGAADLSTVPLWLIDRVTVYRGNAPFEADRLGIGGAIFFEPLRPRATMLSIGAGAGSYGNRSAFAYATARDEQRALLIGVGTAGAKNNYRYTPQEGPAGTSLGDQRLTNADASLLDFWLIAQSRVRAGNVEVLVNHFERERGVTRLAVLPTLDARERFERNLGAVTARAPLGSRSSLELRTSALVAASRLDDPREPTEVLGGLGMPGHRLEQRGERVEEELAVRVEPGAATRVRLALSGANERLRRYEQAEAPDARAALDARRLTGRLAGMGEQDLSSWLTLKALMALECHETSASGAPGGCDTLEPVGRLGALLHHGGFSGFLALGRYTRTPTLGELFGTSIVAHGNAALVPESDLTVDAGVRYGRSLVGEARPLYAALSAYARHASDMIKWVPTSQKYLVAENVQRADVLGLELESGAGFARYFAAELGITLADFRDHSPGSPYQNDLLPHHSRLVLAPALEAVLPDVGQGLTHPTLGARLLYQSSSYNDDAGTEIIPEQTSLDLDAAVGFLRGVVTIRGRVTDVLDAKRYDVVGFPLPRRSAFLSAEVRLGPL